ncbi:ankyrin repeat domain-containing protein 61-like [Anolis sagrei]|uniref:ankyrin repeat domain-containing protein 61-like n=1 Tax=Anolis sagrei TaxID=38937 RepID=UPI003522FF7C
MAQSKLTKKPRGRWMKQNTQNEDPEMSRETTGCSSSKHQRTEESNNKVALHLKLKEDFNKTRPLFPPPDYHPLHLAIVTGYPHIIPGLLKRGAQINDRDMAGRTALHLASEVLNLEAMTLLLRCGANVNLITPATRETALHLAVRSSSCKAGIILAAGSKCVELLLFNGANIHMKDWKGQEAIHKACRNGREDIIKLLFNYGADVNSLTPEEESPLFLFLEKPSNLRKLNVLRELLRLTYPLKLMNSKGHLPKALYNPSCELLHDLLRDMAAQVWSLQDICKFNVRKVYRGTMKCWLKGMIPAQLWNSIYIRQEYSYASKMK